MKFGTLITAMITPFDQGGQLDIKEAIRIAVHLVDTGTDTVLLAGTTGESPTLNHDEESQLFQEVSKALQGKAKVMALDSVQPFLYVESEQESFSSSITSDAIHPAKNQPAPQSDCELSPL